MTKSFVAAAMLQLRDEGSLTLEDEVASYVRALARLELPTSDSAPLRLRDLMSMSSGFPEDDPWADRLMSLDAGEVDRVLESIGTFAHPPGVAYEYSNLGWVLLGRVVKEVSGMTAQEFITERITRPLGMTSTVWQGAMGDVLTGYRVEDDRWVEELDPLPDGDFAPMAGLWSTVADLARWVAFLLDAFPPRDDPDSSPLARASRREMQQVHRSWRSSYDSTTGRLDAGGYGFGLMVTHDLRFGHVVGHPGGLPGFGSHMRWLPGRGVGAIALANRTYAPMAKVTLEILELLDDAGALSASGEVNLSPGLLAAADGLCDLLNDWDDGAAGVLFSSNVLLDESSERRGARAGELRQACGVLHVGSIEPESATRGLVTFAGERGSVQVSVLLTPESTPRIQKYDVVSDHD